MKNINPFQGKLTDKEYQQLISLEYILTWGYTYNYNSDLVIFKKLIEKQQTLNKP